MAARAQGTARSPPSPSRVVSDRTRQVYSIRASSISGLDQNHPGCLVAGDLGDVPVQPILLIGAVALVLRGTYRRVRIRRRMVAKDRADRASAHAVNQEGQPRSAGGLPQRGAEPRTLLELNRERCAGSSGASNSRKGTFAQVASTARASASGRFPWRMRVRVEGVIPRCVASWRSDTPCSIRASSTAFHSGASLSRGVSSSRS